MLERARFSAGVTTRQPSGSWRRLNRLGAAVVMSLLLAGSGCGGPDKKAIELVSRGEYGRAREHIARKLPADKANRAYMYERMKLCLVDLADGLPDLCENLINETYEVLRTQGINADKTVASVVVNERVKFWKGEPFEQAMMFVYISMQKAMRGEWDNARAAAGGSLFLLKDFGENTHGQRKSTYEIAQDAVRDDQKSEKKHRKKDKDRDDSKQGDYLDKGYTPRKTNFALGYLLAGVTNLVLGREDEAADNFNAAVEASLALKPVAEALAARNYNTVLVVDYGMGPRKIGYGPDKALAKFVPVTPSDGRPLRVSVNDHAIEPVPSACDLNVMAADHMWNNLEDVRVAKSVLGTALLAGGAAMAVGSDSRDAQVAGLIMMAVGAAAKASARADTRHCEVMPQRVYVAPVTIAAPASTIELQVEGDRASRLVLPDVTAPHSPAKFQLFYVRLTPSAAGQRWGAGGKVLYANDRYPGRVPGDELPYILGGRCCRAPNHETLSRYQQSGFLRDMTVAELQDLYRAEGIIWSVTDQGGSAGAHVLEGGNLLECPVSGSAGYVRLFCQEHAAYKPRSSQVRDLAARLHGSRLATRTGAAEIVEPGAQ